MKPVNAAHMRALFLGVFFMMAGQANADVAIPENAWVELLESDDSLCLAHGGKLVSLKLTDTAMAVQQEPVEVWVDRWFMQVQTADHTKHVLTMDAPEKDLGCSQSIAGPQHWTLSTVKRLSSGSAATPKE